DGIRDFHVTGVQTCALPIWLLYAGAVDVGRSLLLAEVFRQREPHFRFGLSGTVGKQLVRNVDERRQLMRGNFKHPERDIGLFRQIGRASCRERVWRSQYAVS